MSKELFQKQAQITKIRLKIQELEKDKSKHQNKLNELKAHYALKAYNDHQSSPQTPTHFHSFILQGVFNLKTDREGWRIVGLWGDEDKGEGNRIGPTFEEAEFEACSELADELESRYGLPVAIETIVSHFG